jgi:hypothetical protein
LWAPYPILAAASDPPNEPEIKLIIRGSGRLKKDRLCVVGDDDHRHRRSVHVVITGFESWESLKADWLTSREEWGDPLLPLAVADTASNQDARYDFLRRQYKVFETRPPTFFLDLETEGRHQRLGWHLSCEVPTLVLSSLAGAVENQNTRAVDLTIELVPSLVREWYAEGSEALTIGVLPTEGRSTICARGWVEDVLWPAKQKRSNVDSSSSTLVLNEEESSHRSEPANTVGNDLAKSAIESQLWANREIAVLARTIRNGFLIIVASVIVLLLLR